MQTVEVLQRPEEDPYTNAVKKSMDEQYNRAAAAMQAAEAQQKPANKYNVRLGDRDYELSKKEYDELLTHLQNKGEIAEFLNKLAHDRALMYSQSRGMQKTASAT